MVNRCAVLWCGRDLWVETAQSQLPCFALCRKTTPNKQRAAKPYKMAMNWAQVTQKKQQQTQVYVSTIYCLHRDFAQKAKSRGGTLVTRAYIKESTYSWNIQSYSQYRKNLDLFEQRPRRPRGVQSVGRSWATCGQISQILNTMHEGDGFSVKILGKCLFQGQKDCSIHGLAGQFWLLKRLIFIKTHLI